MSDRNYNKDILAWDKFPEHDLIYCDPPWGSRLVKLFETMMVKAGQERPNNTIEKILEKLGELASPEKLLVIEYGIKKQDYSLVVSIMESFGHKLKSVNVRQQSNGNDYVILVFNQSITVSKLKGFDGVTDTLRGVQGNKVFDPFAGIGLTAKAVKKAGKEYIGSEPNRERYLKLCKTN